MESSHPGLVVEPNGEEAGLEAHQKPRRLREPEDPCAAGVGEAVESEAVDADADVFVVDVDGAVGALELGAVDDDWAGHFQNEGGLGHAAFCHGGRGGDDHFGDGRRDRRLGDGRSYCDCRCWDYDC